MLSYTVLAGCGLVRWTLPAPGPRGTTTACQALGRPGAAALQGAAPLGSAGLRVYGPRVQSPLVCLMHQDVLPWKPWQHTPCTVLGYTKAAHN